MSEFKREERYIVIKRNALLPAEEREIRGLLSELGVDTVACVVVESDWSIYEPVWAMVEDEWRKRQA